LVASSCLMDSIAVVFAFYLVLSLSFYFLYRFLNFVAIWLSMEVGTPK
jgi:hypothetical protein